MKTALEQLKEKLLKSDEYKKEVSKQDLSFEIAESIINARIKKGMTQKELAKKLETQQSGVARLESGRNYPSFKTLEKIAKILGVKIMNPLGVGGNNTATNYFNIPTEWFNNNAVVEHKSSMVNSVLYNL
ncbi:MAG: helix-turn-helix transcriptional regulator [Bacilli bacterium]|nr:helix-turn-helix transcriptional regulator [Bacilli bacterium]